MRILFVYPNLNKQLTPQIGITSLVACLRDKHDIAFFDFSLIKNREIEEFTDTIVEFHPDVVLFSCRTMEWDCVKNMAKISFPTPVIVGGIHPTVDPEEVIKHVNILVRGEGEETIVELLDKMSQGKDITSVANVWVRQKGKVYRNEVRPLIKDLDKLPFPEWRVFDQLHYNKSYIRNLYPWIECVGAFESTRGCPFSCTYCCNDYLQTLYKGKGSYHRRKSPGRVAHEVKLFKHFYPHCNFVYFVDDTFMVDEDWLKDFSKLYDKTPFVFMTRVEMVTEKKMQMIAEMGGKSVSMGIESGNEKFRKEVLKRNMSQEQIIKAFKIAKDYGLKVYSFNMVGLPYETVSDIQSTIDLNQKVKPDIAQFTVFYPFVGTKLFDICVKEGYLKGKITPHANYYDFSVLDLPNFQKGEITKWVLEARRKCN